MNKRTEKKTEEKPYKESQGKRDTKEKKKKTKAGRRKTREETNKNRGEEKSIAQLVHHLHRLRLQRTKEVFVFPSFCNFNYLLIVQSMYE